MKVHLSDCGPYPEVDIINRIEANKKIVTKGLSRDGREMYIAAFDYVTIMPNQYLEAKDPDRKWIEKLLLPTLSKHFFNGERKCIYVQKKKNKRVVEIKWTEHNVEKLSK